MRTGSAASLRTSAPRSSSWQASTSKCAWRDLCVEQRISGKPRDYWAVMETLTAFVRERTQRTEAERTARPREQRLNERAYELWDDPADLMAAVMNSGHWPARWKTMGSRRPPTSLRC